MEARDEMKAPGFRKLLTHVGALAIGALLAWMLRETLRGPSNHHGTEGQGAPLVSADKPKDSGGPVDAASRIGKARPDFEGAWAALSSVPAAERDEVRRRLLKDWIAMDPDGAMEAVMEAVVRLDDVGKFELLECFGPLFDKNPEWFLTMLQSHRYQLRGVAVRDWWASRMAATDPAKLVRLARGFGPLDGAYLIGKAMAGATTDQERLNAAFAAMQEMPVGPETTRLWKAAGKGLAELDMDILEGRFLEASNPEVKALFGQALAKSLANKQITPERRAEILARTPSDRRTSLALDMAKEAGGNSSAITAAIDSVVATPDWTGNAKRLASQLHNSTPSGADAARVANWAASIPEREDTEDLYRTAVRYYLQQQPAAEVRQWMTGMPAGWRRDNTLAAWVQTNASYQKLDEAQWALERIQSPHFRSEGEKWISAAKERAQ